MTSPLDLSLAGASRLLQDGGVSARDLTAAALQRIEALDGALGSFVHVSAGALADAEIADREIRAGGRRGPLHGIPLAVKDNYTTADMPTLAGTSAPGTRFPMQDATAVRRLRDAGAILVGKTRTHEYAWGTVTPSTSNPWNLGRVPGGSSGGSAAAVAAGLCFGSLGSDTGGSVRIPASLCGVVGIKPTFGRIGRGGIVPHSWSLDHPGPLARSVEDAAILLGAIAGFDPDDPASSRHPVPDDLARLDGGIRDVRVGICRNHFFGRNQPDVDRAVEVALDVLGRETAETVEFELPNLDYGLAAIFAIELASSGAYHDAALRSGRVGHYQPDVRLLVEMGRLVTGVDYLKAEQLRRVLIENYRRVFARVDVIIGPTTPLTAWPHAEWTVDVGGAPESVLAASWRLTYPYNLTGLPAVSIPCGFDRHGLPIGLQIAGRPWEERTVLQVAHAFEAAHGWGGQLASPPHGFKPIARSGPVLEGVRVVPHATGPS